MTWKVVAPLVLAADPDGQVHHVYAGGVIDWLSDEQAQLLLAEGMVAGCGGEVAPPPPPPAGDDGSGRPDEHATKAALIDWLVANAEHDDGSDYTEAELRPHTKDQLWELIDTVG